jgi:2-iminobutanoate/2-iminopropanoate deaminase
MSNAWSAEEVVIPMENADRMAKREGISTPGAPRAIGPYVQAVRSGGWLFLSGQIPLNPETGVMIEGGIEEQTRRIMENLKAVLEAGGSSFARVVRTTVYLTNMADFAAVNGVYGGYFEGVPPARSTVAVAALPRGALLEIDAIAMV